MYKTGTRIYGYGISGIIQTNTTTEKRLNAHEATRGVAFRPPTNTEKGGVFKKKLSSLRKKHRKPRDIVYLPVSIGLRKVGIDSQIKYSIRIYSPLQLSTQLGTAILGFFGLVVFIPVVGGKHVRIDTNVGSGRRRLQIGQQTRVGHAQRTHIARKRRKADISFVRRRLR